MPFCHVGAECLTTWTTGLLQEGISHALMFLCLKQSVLSGSINALIASTEHQLLSLRSHCFCCTSLSWTGACGPWMMQLPFCYVDCFLSWSHTFLNWSLSWSSFEVFHCYHSKPVNMLCFFFLLQTLLHSIFFFHSTVIVAVAGMIIAAYSQSPNGSVIPL